MRSTLYLKFLLVYIISGFLSVFVVALLTDGMVKDRLLENSADSIYRQVSVTASDYMPGYFGQSIEPYQASTMISGMEKQLNAAVWFLDKEGKVLLSAAPSDYADAPDEVADFNPAEIGSSRYMLGNYHGYFDREVMSVIAPVVYGMSPQGYLMVHKDTQSINAEADSILNAIYLAVGITYLLSFVILFAFNFFVYRPLRKITEAATQYASGNLDYTIPVNSNDEIGYLSASLNYMAAQLKDMETYQRTFVANVSHDFRSPLTSIRGYIQAMADGTIPEEMRDKYFKIILFETDRLTDLTRDLLTLSAYDKNKMVLNREFFDLHEMIKNVASSFEGTCTEKKISIDLVLATKSLEVYADPQKIQQVLYNLIDNAIKFSEPDSIVTVETTEVNDRVSVSVKDDGIGVPSRELNKIWDRFYKSDASRGKDKKGTGLGLAIVKDIMNAHNESIHVASTEGVGTEFSFTLPKRKPKE